ncbi:glycoside hydrolase family 85 protein [Moniliophthora roreri]|nr:glycoside hydrolase family 85 protein [Moniliophthora roreri]
MSLRHLPASSPVAYFDSLEELDRYQFHSRSSVPLPLRYNPRTGHEGTELLVCHDYKGGYKETPHKLDYTFSWFHFCKTFVYFSHHRVTIPPAGWITAAHRQGTQILGTLIFEHADAEPDCLRLLVGKLPTSPSSAPKTQTLPISPHYARKLAELAKERGFDGYLLNFECPLRGGVEQTRALATWITLLRKELRRQVGDWAQVVWYDSVVFNGQLAWQDRLNAFNLPFFLASGSIFTNYTWRNTYPALTSNYFPTLNTKDKKLEDIYVGVDIWGRGSHGNGGFGAYKALHHITNPTFTTSLTSTDHKNGGLSVAIFGQAWTYESIQDSSNFTWEGWFEYDRLLWTGLQHHENTSLVVLPEMIWKRGESDCSDQHAEWRAFKDYVDVQPPPKVDDLKLHTTFSPGVGKAWFVQGQSVYSKEWTEIGHQTSLGNLVWPSPNATWESGCGSITPKVELGDAWNGGSSLRLLIAGQHGNEEESVFRSLRIPIQSCVISGTRWYEYVLVYKLPSPPDDVEIDVSLSISSDSKAEVEVKTGEGNEDALGNGWARLCVQFHLDGNGGEFEAKLGLNISILSVSETPSLAEVALLVGQMNVYPLPGTRPTPMILWADYDASTKEVIFEVATSVPPLPLLHRLPNASEEIEPAWPTLLEDAIPELLYANIYLQLHENKEEKVWVGTTSYGERSFSLSVDGSNGKKQIWVQGVTDTGAVLDWERCAHGSL